MTWYSAHIIIGMQKNEDRESPITVWENVILIEASSFEEAQKQAEILGKEEEILDDKLTIDDKPVTRIFAGVRKVVSISNSEPPQDTVPPSYGTELTYSEYEVPDLKTLMELGSGTTVTLRYLE